MNNKTTYTHDLLLKMNLINTAKTRQTVLIYALLTGALSAVLIIADLLFESVHTLYVEMFFLSLSLLSFFAVIKNRKSKISEAVKKQIQENPNKIIEYQFEDDFITINQASDKVQSNTHIEYSYISKVVKIDENSFYFVTKNPLFYVLYDEKGIAELFTYVRSKINQ